MSERRTIITDRPDPHCLNGFTDYELERDAREWADDHGLIDYTVTIVHGDFDAHVADAIGVTA